MDQARAPLSGQAWLQRRMAYRGFLITPLAAYDGGLYAAMVIIGDCYGSQRASGVLGQFASAEEACSYALVFGKEEVDRRFAMKPISA
jgi:hypothetical protein